MKFTFAPEATPLAGFTIKRAIDRGGFGEVYYALSDSGKEVALKLLLVPLQELEGHFFAGVAERVINFAEPAPVDGAFDGEAGERRRLGCKGEFHGFLPVR